MSQLFPTRPVSSPPGMPVDQAALLACARSLQADGQAGTTQPLLRGRKIGLLTDAPESHSARLFRSAAARLGAHVSLIGPGESRPLAEAEVRHTAELLGRLYDAIECQGLARDTVEQLERAAGVPVYDGLATADHPTSLLADQLADAATPPDEARSLVLQAVLLKTIA